MRRKQIDFIRKDLEKKIVFIVGPRQVGKTWLAKEIVPYFSNPVYLNYDHYHDRKIIEEMSWLEDTDLLILDELHKMPQWKNYLKGVYDTRSTHLKLLVTGSARLDTFRQSGDSLAGRFFRHRLLPFSPAEIESERPAYPLSRFMDRGGFPEPFLADSETDANRWRMQYVDGLIRSDILDFESISDLRAIQAVFDLLRHRVGSPVSSTSIAREVGIAPNTVKKYLQILENLFIIFRVAPYTQRISRSILKEPKYYFFDNGLVQNGKGPQFENLVAVCLLKHVFGWVDYQGENYGLNYLRTKEGKEVDFCISKDNQIIRIIEAKYNDSNFDSNLVYFSEKYQLPGVQVVLNNRLERKKNQLQLMNADHFLGQLFL